MSDSTPTLWLTPVDANGERWPVMASATIEQGGPKDVVRMFDRKGDAAGTVQLPPGDGEEFLRRLGMEVSHA
jgi:hypothetical protein